MTDREPSPAWFLNAARILILAALAVLVVALARALLA